MVSLIVVVVVVVIVVVVVVVVVIVEVVSVLSASSCFGPRRRLDATPSSERAKRHREYRRARCKRGLSSLSAKSRCEHVVCAFATNQTTTSANKISDLSFLTDPLLYSLETGGGALGDSPGEAWKVTEWSAVISSSYY